MRHRRTAIQWIDPDLARSVGLEIKDYNLNTEFSGVLCDCTVNYPDDNMLRTL